MSARYMSKVDKEILEEKQKKAKRKRQNLELLAIKKPTTTDDVRARVPTPRNPLPTNALPEWKGRRLDLKFPAIPAPEGTFIVSQGMIGQRIFFEKANQDFDAVDPFIHDTPIEYQSLHDPNLKEYFQTHPAVCKQLVDCGLVTCDGQVICGLTEFNKYRSYLGRLQNNDVSRVQREREEWEQNEHTNMKQLSRYIKTALKHKSEEERKIRREKYVAEQAEKTHLRKLRALEHPSNYLKEKRLIESKIRKFKRTLGRKSVMDRVKRIKDADNRKCRQLLLDWICKDEFREKLRCVNKLEKEINKQQDLNDFVETKRAFQEKKQKYHKALLRREKLESECKVMKRYEGYLQRRIDDDEKAIEGRRKAKERAERIYYLMDKYGHRWLNLTRKYTGNPLHSSTWHIRNILHGLVKHVKAESGAKDFSAYLRDLLKSNNKGKEEIAPESKEVVNSILNLLLERSYRDFIRRATTCLVDFVVDEARKKCSTHVCQESWDPSDLEAPVYPKRKRNQITLPKPSYPVSGCCAEYARTGNWPCSCSQQLQDLHEELCENLLKKLTKCMKRAMKTCGSRGLDGLESRARKARGSSLVCGAVDATADVAKCRAGGPRKEMDICQDHKKVDTICKDLCASILGPEPGPSNRRDRPCGGPIKHKGPGSRTLGVGERKPMRDGASGTGPASTANKGAFTPKKSFKDASSASGYVTTDSEADGIPIAPTTGKGTGPGKTDRGIGGNGPAGVNQKTGATGPRGVDKGTAGLSSSERGAQKSGPGKSDAGTAGKAPGVDSGTAGGITTKDGGTDGTRPDTAEQGTADRPGQEAGTDGMAPPLKADAGQGSGKGGEAATQASRPTEAEAGVGDPKTAADKGLGEPGAATAETGVGKDRGADAGTDKPGPGSKDQGAGKPPGQDEGTDKSPPGTAETSTDGSPGKDAATGKEKDPSATTGTGTPDGEEKGVGVDKRPGSDKDAGTDPSKDQGTTPSGQPGSDNQTGTDPAAEQGTETSPLAGVDKGAGKDAGPEKGTEAQQAPGSEKDTSTNRGDDKETEATPKPGDEKGTGQEAGPEKGTEAKPAPGDEKSTDPQGGAEQGTEAKPAPGDDKSTGPQSGPDRGTDTTPLESSESGTSPEPKREEGAETSPISKSEKDSGTGPQPEQGTEAKPKPGEEKGTEPPGASEKGTDSERTPGSEEGTSPDDQPEAGTTAKPGPGQDKGTDKEAGPEKSTEARPGGGEDQGTDSFAEPGTDEGTDPEAGREAGTSSESKAGEDKDTDTAPGKEAGTEAKPKPGVDDGTDSERPEGTESGEGPEPAVSDGTDPSRVRDEERGEGTSQPGTTGQQTDRPDGIDKDTEKLREDDQDAGTGIDRDDKGVEKPRDATTSDGTGPDEGEGRSVQCSKTPSQCAVGTDRPQEDQGTDGRPKEPGQDEGVGADGTRDCGVAKPGDETDETCTGTRDGTGESGTGLEGPYCTNVSTVCGPDPTDNVEVCDDIPFDIDQMLATLCEEMVQDCLHGAVADAPKDKQGQTESHVGCSLSDEIDTLLEGELKALTGTCTADQYLEEKCKGLTSGERDRCLEEAVRHLKTRCMGLSTEQKEKCLEQVGKILAPTTQDFNRPDQSGELSRAASCVVASVLSGQADCGVVGAGDDQVIPECMSEDNMSRIASNIVKQAISNTKCTGPATETKEVGTNVAASPAVQNTVRERLSHIRTILDEVKSDLATVGVHPTFGDTGVGAARTQATDPSLRGKTEQGDDKGAAQ